MGFKLKSKMKTGIILLCITTVIFPFYWLIVTSIKKPEEIFSSNPSLVPKNISFENYGVVFQETALGKYFINSILITVVTVTIVMFIASLAAYGVSRYKFRGKKIFFLIILISQMLPLTTLIIPLYIFWGKLNLLNHYVSLILTYSGFMIPIGIWLLTSYFNSIPKSLDESATLDGCSTFRILFAIILPLAKPGIMAASLSIIISTWQELMISMTFTTNDSMRTLPAGVINFITSQGIKWGPLTAAGVLTCLPVIIMYAFLQKALIKGLTAGATKG